MSHNANQHSNPHRHNGFTTPAFLELINHGNTQNGDGTGNKLGVMTDAINSNTITGNGKLDTINTTLGNLASEIQWEPDWVDLSKLRMQ